MCRIGAQFLFIIVRACLITKKSSYFKNYKKRTKQKERSKKKIKKDKKKIENKKNKLNIIKNNKK